jgi:hypothetical protein
MGQDEPFDLERKLRERNMTLDEMLSVVGRSLPVVIQMFADLITASSEIEDDAEFGRYRRRDLASLRGSINVHDQDTSINEPRAGLREGFQDATRDTPALRSPQSSAESWRLGSPASTSTECPFSTFGLPAGAMHNDGPGGAVAAAR